MSKQHISLDVIIAGGGASGMALALSLLQSTDFRIGIIEANPSLLNDKQNASEAQLDVRSIALSAFSCDFLQRIGLTSLSEMAQPIERIHVSDRGYAGRVELDAAEFERDYLGQVVELERLNQGLLAQLKPIDDTRLTWFCPEHVEQLSQDDSGVEVTLSGGQLLRCKLLVIAEGGHSPTRQLAGFSTDHKSYEQHGIVANVRLDRDHHNCAYERFTDSGPLALLPMQNTDSHHPQRQCSLVWTVKNGQQQALLDASDNEFLSQLQDAFGYRLGNFVEVGARQSFPLSLLKCQQHVRHRIALVGNAAQTLHPIAGQGLNLGIRDIASLSACLQGQLDPGAFEGLWAYQKARKPDQTLTCGATDMLVSVFSNHLLPMVVGRNLGLLAMQSSSSLKRFFAMQAMGYNQRETLDAKL